MTGNWTPPGFLGGWGANQKDPPRMTLDEIAAERASVEKLVARLETWVSQIDKNLPNTAQKGTTTRYVIVRRSEKAIEELLRRLRRRLSLLESEYYARATSWSDPRLWGVDPLSPPTFPGSSLMHGR